MKLKKLLRDSGIERRTEGDSNGNYNLLTIPGQGKDPEQVRKAMEKALGRKVTMEIEELCWCGCGQPIKV